MVGLDSYMFITSLSLDDLLSDVSESLVLRRLHLVFNVIKLTAVSKGFILGRYLKHPLNSIFINR